MSRGYFLLNARGEKIGFFMEGPTDDPQVLEYLRAVYITKLKKNPSKCLRLVWKL